MNNRKTGNEKFVCNGRELNMTLLDFWQYSYSQIYDLQDSIAEFIVSKALGEDSPVNKDSWTLFDILYRDCRVEIKETAYYHAFNKEGKVSESRTFGIAEAYSKYKDKTSELARQSEVYVFCLITGKDKESGDPLNLDNWEFYIIPTSVINEKCKKNKSISLGRVRKLAQKTEYGDIKKAIDQMIDTGVIKPKKTETCME